MTETAYQVTIGERVMHVVLRRQGDQDFARIDDGPEMAVALGPVEGALYALRVGDRRREVAAARAGDDVSVVLAGTLFHAQVVDEVRARLAGVVGAQQAGPSRRDLKAPMPGLVVRVLCEPGQPIEKGHPLVVLQAMKMENELSLPYPGTVQIVNVQPGQTVEQGETLLVLE